MQEVVSPLNGCMQLGDLPNRIATEIEEGILHLGNEKRSVVKAGLKRLKGRSNNELEYSLLLFRRYSEMANQNKEHNLELESQVSFPVLLPASGNDSKLLVGFNAFQSNLFWLRLVAAIFAIILFTVMLTIPNFDHAHWDPGADFLVSTLYYLPSNVEVSKVIVLFFVLHVSDWVH